MIWVLPPVFSCIVDRESAPEAGNARKNEENKFAEPNASSSWFGRMVYLCFLAKIFPKDRVTAKQTILSIMESKNKLGIRSNRGTVGVGSLQEFWIRTLQWERFTYPVGTVLTTLIAKLSWNLNNQDIRMEKTTRRRSIGTGREFRFFSFGSISSLKTTRIVIIKAEYPTL